MGFIQKIKQAVSGKDNFEKKYEKAANREINKLAKAAQLRERREQAIKFAQESERIKYQQKLNELKRPKPKFSGFNVVAPEYRNYGSVTGSPRLLKERKITRTVGKGKNKRKKSIIIRKAQKNPIMPMIYPSKNRGLGF